MLKRMCAAKHGVRWLSKRDRRRRRTCCNIRRFNGSLRKKGAPCFPQNAPGIAIATPQSRRILKELVLEYERLTRPPVPNRNVDRTLPFPRLVPSVSVPVQCPGHVSRLGFVGDWRRFQLDLDQQHILLGVFGTKAVEVAYIAAIWRLQCRQTRVEEENLLIDIGDGCRICRKSNWPRRDGVYIQR